MFPFASDWLLGLRCKPFPRTSRAKCWRFNLVSRLRQRQLEKVRRPAGQKIALTIISDVGCSSGTRNVTSKSQSCRTRTAYSRDYSRESKHHGTEDLFESVLETRGCKQKLSRRGKARLYQGVHWIHPALWSWTQKIIINARLPILGLYLVECYYCNSRGPSDPNSTEGVTCYFFGTSYRPDRPICGVSIMSNYELWAGLKEGLTSNSYLRTRDCSMATPCNYNFSTARLF